MLYSLDSVRQSSKLGRGWGRTRDICDQGFPTEQETSGAPAMPRTSARIGTSRDITSFKKKRKGLGRWLSQVLGMQA